MDSFKSSREKYQKAQCGGIIMVFNNGKCVTALIISSMNLVNFKQYYTSVYVQQSLMTLNTSGFLDSLILV